MVEMVPRKRAEREVPWKWVPKYDLESAMREHNNYLHRKAKAIASSQGISTKKAKDKYGLHNLSIDEFARRIQGTPSSEYRKVGAEKSEIEQSYLSAPPRLTPWWRKRGYLARKISMPRSVTRKPITGENIGVLSDRLKKMDYGHGLRLIYRDFGAGETISTARQVTDEIVKMIEDRGIPTWPGVKPEQIGFMFKTPEGYRMGFVKNTQYAGTEGMYSKLRKKVPKRPREIIDGNIWLVPHIVERKKPYDMARVILGRDKNIESTYGNSPSEYFKLTPVE